MIPMMTIIPQQRPSTAMPTPTRHEQAQQVERRHELDVSDDVSTEAAEPADGGSEPAPIVQSARHSRLKEAAKEILAMTSVASALSRTWSTSLLSETSSLTQLAAPLNKNEHRQLISELRGHTDRTKSCRVFDNDKKVLSCSDDNTLRVWDLETQKCELTLGCDRSELLEHRQPESFPKHLAPFSVQETTLRPGLV